jgi:hypothetical protein
MLGLRVISLLVLAIWLGGLATLGFVAAPAIFAALQAADPAAGRSTAGLVFGEVFDRFQYVSLGIAVVLIALLIVRALLGPRPVRLAWRVWTIALMAAISAVTLFVISPRIDRLRQEVPGAIAALPDADPRKTEFGQLHGLSNVLMLASLAGGVGLLWMEARDH